jgi:raffinose/stachyose/melibiose transport system substrate-binding protein
MKKRMVLVLAVMLIVAASACAEGKAEGKVTVSFLVNQGWVLTAEPELAQKFEAKTGIKIDYQLTPTDQYENVLLTKLNAGELADIFAHQNGKFDMDPQLHIVKNGVDLSGEDWVKRMDPGAIEHDSVNGKLYGQTLWDFSPTFPIVYNKDIFAKLGLKVPTNYAELKIVCQKLLDAGITPIYEPVADGWPVNLWFLDIGEVYEAATPGLENNLNQNKATFAGNALMRTCLEQMQEMAQLGFFGKNYLSDQWSGIEKALGTGKYAMVMDNLSTPDQIHKAYPDVKAESFGFFENPLADNQILDKGAQGPTRFIFSGSKYIKQAKQYFSYLAQTENLQYLLDNDQTKLDLCFAGLKNKYTPAVKEFIAMYPKSGTYMQIQVKYLNPQWMDTVKDQVALMMGKMTPDQVLKGIDERRAQQAQAAKDPFWKN